MTTFIGPQRIVSTARASVGIFSVLKTLCRGGEVVVPVNLCPAAVYPIVYSGNRPIFCDIANETGNVSLSCIRSVVTQRTQAVLVPHMYGNPVRDIQSIVDYCHKRDIFVIEDCASAMGATINGRMVGTFGDYSIFSTGHAKIVDLGGGGMVCSWHDLHQIEMTVKCCERNASDNSRLESDFARCYRRFLNTRMPFALFAEKTFFFQDFSPLFVHCRHFCDQDVLLDNILQRIDESIVFHRSAQIRMEKIFLIHCPHVRIYHNAVGSVPWRFSFFIEAKRRQKVADALLAHQMPVSDWYPPIGQLFGDSRIYPIAEKMGRTILNLPHTMTDEAFVKASMIIRRSQYE